MNRSVLLLSVVAFFIYLSLTSYSTGPASGTPSLGNRTGTGGIAANCSGTGCHGAIDPNVYVYFTFKDVFLGDVTNGIYKPGKKYKITLNPKYPTNITAKFGFQLTVVRSPSNVDVGNTIVAPANTHLKMVNNITVLEHSTPLGAAGQALITFDWTAPPAGSGKIAFYAVANAVNDNGVADANDRAVALTWEYNEGPASVTELSQDIKITAFPNPSTDQFNLRFDDAVKGEYSINVIDVTGRNIFSNNISIKTPQASATIPASNWAPGIYFAQIMKDGAQRMIAVSKR